MPARGEQIIDSRAEYGKAGGTSQEDAGFFRDQGNAAQQRTAGDTYGAKLDQDKAQEQAARGQQQGALDLQRQAAMGTAPSQAAILGQQQSQQAVAAQRAQAASARGPQAMAMAQGNAAGNSAAAQSQIATATMAQRAQEMAQARGEYMQGSSQVRAGDQQNRGMSAGEAQFQSSLDQRERAQNDAYSSQMYGNEIGVNTQAQNAQNAAVTAQEAYDVAMRESDRKDLDQTVGLVKDIGGALGSAASAFSDVRTKQGAAKPGDEKMDALIGSMGNESSKTAQVPGAMGAGFDPLDPGNASAKFSGANAPASLFGAQGSRGPADGAPMRAASSGGAPGGGQTRYDGQSNPMSDERSKEGKRGAGDGDVERMLKSFKGAEYSYKPEYADKPGGDRGEQFGPASAQAIEKTELGKNIVDTDEDGMKRIDGQQAIKALMASVSYLNDKIEARK